VPFFSGGCKVRARFDCNFGVGVGAFLFLIMLFVGSGFVFVVNGVCMSVLGVTCLLFVVPMCCVNGVFRFVDLRVSVVDPCNSVVESRDFIVVDSGVGLIADSMAFGLFFGIWSSNGTN
jgi:hypothetical protein